MESQVLPGRNGNDDMEFDVNILRRVATNVLNLMGLDPAYSLMEEAACDGIDTGSVSYVFSEDVGLDDS